MGANRVTRKPPVWIGGGTKVCPKVYILNNGEILIGIRVVISVPCPLVRRGEAVDSTARKLCVLWRSLSDELRHSRMARTDPRNCYLLQSNQRRCRDNRPYSSAVACASCPMTVLCAKDVTHDAARPRVSSLHESSCLRSASLFEIPMLPGSFGSFLRDRCQLSILARTGINFSVPNPHQRSTIWFLIVFGSCHVDAALAVRSVDTQRRMLSPIDRPSY